MELRDVRHAHFRESGFMVVRNVLSPEEVATLRLPLHRRIMAHGPRHWACRRLCSPVVIALFLLHSGAVAGTDERERLQLPEPVAAAQSRESLLLIALTYPGAQQGRDRCSGWLALSAPRGPVNTINGAMR